MPEQPERAAVELHIVSDSTGETAARLVLALEAQFPDQPFVEIRHPRVENVEDLHIAVQQARGRPAVMVYTLVEPGLRDAMRQLCRRARVHYCDLLGHPIDSISRVAGVAAQMQPGAQGAARRAVLQADRGDRVRREVRRRRRPRARRGGHRARRRLPHVEDAALDLPRLPRPEGGERPGRRRHRAAGELFEIDPAKIVGLTIAAERLADIRTARVRTMGGPRRKYAALEQIYSELEEAAAIHRRLGCPVIDVTELSVEETAARIIRLVERRRRKATVS